MRKEDVVVGKKYLHKASAHLTSFGIVVFKEPASSQEVGIAYVENRPDKLLYLSYKFLFEIEETSVAVAQPEPTLQAQCWRTKYYLTCDNHGFVREYKVVDRPDPDTCWQATQDIVKGE